MEYKRDKRSPKPKSKLVSKRFSKIGAKDTRPERKFRKALREIGLTGYRLQWKKVPGKPDVAFPGKKIAIFINGCYWHRCPHCKLKVPNHNTEFWAQKFQKNVERDQRKIKELESLGWKVFVFWECKIKENSSVLAKEVLLYYAKY